MRSQLTQHRLLRLEDMGKRVPGAHASLRSSLRVVGSCRVPLPFCFVMGWAFCSVSASRDIQEASLRRLAAVS
jgi:hypothetical protein